MANYVKLTDDSFAKEVEQAKEVVLVDFWAPWCGPCQMLGPIIEEIADELKADKEVKITKIVVDEAPESAMKYNVSAIPALLIFKNGEVVEQANGVMPKADIIALIKKAKVAKKN